MTGKLRDAWSEYRRAVDELNRLKSNKDSSASDKKTASNAVNTALALVKSLDRTLGLPSGAQTPGSFNLGVYQRMLNNSLAETERWRASLTKIGQRGGEEVRALLEGMGSDGYELVNSLAGASDQMFKDITAKLVRTGTTAKATLADLTRQLGASTKESKEFASDLQTLAARGFGDLAQALAAQGGSAGAQLARQAVTGNQADAKAANSAVGSANATLDGEELTQSLVMLSTLRGGPNRGFSELIAAGLSPSTIRSLAPRIMGQIHTLPAEFKGRFLQQLVGQAGGTAMAREASSAPRSSWRVRRGPRRTSRSTGRRGHATCWPPRPASWGTTPGPPDASAPRAGRRSGPHGQQPAHQRHAQRRQADHRHAGRRDRPLRPVRRIGDPPCPSSPTSPRPTARR